MERAEFTSTSLDNETGLKKSDYTFANCISKATLSRSERSKKIIWLK